MISLLEGAQNQVIINKLSVYINPSILYERLMYLYWKWIQPNKSKFDLSEL